MAYDLKLVVISSKCTGEIVDCADRGATLLKITESKTSRAPAFHKDSRVPWGEVVQPCVSSI